MQVEKEGRVNREAWETIKRHYLYWWNNDFLDRIPLWVTAPKDDPRSREILMGKGLWIRKEERFDSEKVVRNAQEILRATFYGGLAFPCYFPNFGTDVFSAYLGAEIEFSDFFPPVATGPSFIQEGVIPVSWARWGYPVLNDYADLLHLCIHEDSVYWQKTKEFVTHALEISQGEFLVGATDIHPSMDALAVLRGSPQNLCLDLVDNPEGVKRAMVLLWEAWVRVYEETYYNLILGQQEGTTAWINLWAPGKSKKKAIIVYCAPEEVELVVSALRPEGLLISVNCESEKEAKELLSRYGWEGVYWWL